MAFVLGIDTGGTFTDCVVVQDDGRLVYDKSLTTAADLSQGVLSAIDNAARLLGLDASTLLESTDALSHGTTALLNTFVTRTGARVGLLTTKGHEDAILIGRVRQKSDGLGEQEINYMVKLDKPEPLVPRPLIKGVTERVDYKGAIVVRLNESEVVEAARDLVAHGVKSLAVCFLWSFMNPSHELKAKAIIKDLYPDLFVSASHEIAAVLGEYERTATTVINSYLGPAASAYLSSLNGRLREQGLKQDVLFMHSMGGVISADEACLRPVSLLSSGPVGGVIGAAALGKQMGLANIITTDMGGTSFDVGLVVDGQPQFARAPVFGRYRVQIPVVDTASIGAGGGSIAWVEPGTGVLNVGPQSAGAYPGPAAYDQGGIEPTVTDADVVLGRINPEHFFGGRLKLNQEKAATAIRGKVAQLLGMSVTEAARAIVDIVDARMADLVRKATIERGYDPTDFALFAYGGGAPTHVAAYGRDVGSRLAIIPALAPVFSAYGIAASDILRTYTKSVPVRLPAAPEGVNQAFRFLEGAARADLRDAGVPVDRATLQRFVDMKFRYQVHEVRMPVHNQPLTSEDLEELSQRFVETYERIYGAGTAYRKAGLEIVTLRLNSIVRIDRPVRQAPSAHTATAPATKSVRPVFFDEGFVDTGVYDFRDLGAGVLLPGPAIIEAPATTVVIHPGQTARVDGDLNIAMDFRSQAAPGRAKNGGLRGRG